MISITEISPVSIFSPQHNDYLEVIGAKMVIARNGQQFLKIECCLGSGEKVLISPYELDRLFAQFPIPF
jgi:hypothetical protein